MDIFLRSVSWKTTDIALTAHLAPYIHSDLYASYQRDGRKANFRVTLFREKKVRGRKHSGNGLLTLPSEGLGRQFLLDYGGDTPSTQITVDGRQVLFSESKQPLRSDIVESVQRMPFVDPEVAAAHERKLQSLRHTVSVTCIQFGWECRDHALSVEWEQICPTAGKVVFDEKKREIIVEFPLPGEPRLHPSPLQPFLQGDLFQLPFDNLEPRNLIRIRYAEIGSIAIDRQSSSPAIFFSLNAPPMFASTIPSLGFTSGPTQRQKSYFDEAHRRVVPFTSTALRLATNSLHDINLFERHCKTIHQSVSNEQIQIVKRDLFSSILLDEFQSWLTQQSLVVAFQCDALLRSLHLDTREILGLRRSIEELVARNGEQETGDALKRFSLQLADWNWFDQDRSNQKSDLESILKKAAIAQRKVPVRALNSDGIFDCYHIKVTPTAVQLEGPYPERSNRVIRSYRGHETQFIRVEFTDEQHLRFRFDRDVDFQPFLNERVGGVLRSGLTISGRHYYFLAYSMSALKEHALWFVEPFIFQGKRVDADTIRTGLGDFKKVIHFPALYAARISQGFTATDPSIKANPEEIFIIDDIERNDRQFTDGVGTLSAELARDISKSLRATKKRKSAKTSHVPAFQVRFGGSKGMLSIDHRLKGRVICLRPSMIKFESTYDEIEIARAFDKPTGMFLNRPMIMLLEGLGVSCDVFLGLQRDAVTQTQSAADDIANAANLLQVLGLGSAFRLPSVFLSLHKLGFNLHEVGPDFLIEDQFTRRLLAYAVNHALRELKHHARIPVPESWTLVGVADVHNYLKEGEIFACIRSREGDPLLFLEGRCVVTRSPVIHPGDVQLVTAIGCPPEGSPYAIEPLANTVVFSVQGDRPLPSYLGGGDLDGDVFNLIMNPDLHPTVFYEPAEYASTERKRLTSPSTVEDVIDFFVEYINSDMVGTIATTWLKIADQSLESIFDKDCLTLSKLYSDAVDYQKSGIPVSRSGIPQPRLKEGPDWSAPETVSSEALANYYESTRAIGILYRDIELPALQDVYEEARIQRRVLADEHYSDDYTDPGWEDWMTGLSLDPGYFLDPISNGLHAQISEFVDLDEEAVEAASMAIPNLFTEYKQELQYICHAYSLSQRKDDMLTEEEVVVGTIVGKTPQHRYRRDLMARMREHSDELVSRIRDELSGENLSHEEWLLRGWAAWKYSVVNAKKTCFGSKSFGYIALGSIFEALRSLEGRDRYASRQDAPFF